MLIKKGVSYILNVVSDVKCDRREKPMKFTKMHGIGNDYVYVNCFEESVKNPAEVSKFVVDRISDRFRWINSY